MAKQYSLYEVKAKLSQVLRYVREGQTVTVTYHGRPIAEIRPIEETMRTVKEQIDDLANRGLLVAASPRRRDKTVRAEIARKPGALKRFLADRE